MSTITIPSGSQPILKTNERPVIREAGEAISVMDAVYIKESDGKIYVADSDPTDTATNVVVGLAITKAETGSFVAYVSSKGTIIDFGGTLTAGTILYLDGSNMVDDWADVDTGDYVSQLGYTNKTLDFVTNIVNEGTVK